MGSFQRIGLHWLRFPFNRASREAGHSIHDDGSDSAILDVAVYQKHLQAANLARLLAPAEAEAAEGHTRPAREFLSELKRARDLPR